MCGANTFFKEENASYTLISKITFFARHNCHVACLGLVLV